MNTTPRYDVIAFYKNTKEEVQFYVEQLNQHTQWHIRYEQLPNVHKLITAFFGEDTTLCIINRNALSDKDLYKYVYKLERPVLIIHNQASISYLRCTCLPVSYARETKEIVAWANYIQRTTDSQMIDIIIPREKDENFVNGVYNNLYYLRKVFTDASARFQMTQVEVKFDPMLQIMLYKADRLILTMRPQSILPFIKPQIFKSLPKTSAQIFIIPTAKNIYVPCH